MRNIAFRIPVWTWPLLIAAGAAQAADNVLSLEDAVKSALEQNPLTRVAGESVAGAKEAVGEARASYYPDLALRASFNRWERHAFLPSGLARPGIPSTIGPTNDWYTGVATRYTLFDFGQRRAEARAARARQGIAQEDAGRVREDIALSVHQAYFGLVASLEMEGVARKALARAEDHLRVARARKEAGAVPQADVMRAQVEVAGAQLALEHAQGMVRVAAGSLNTAMGVPVEASVEVDRSPREIIPPANINLAEALERAVSARPELRGARQRIEASRRTVDVARSAYGPKVKGEASLGWRDTTYFPQDKDWLVGVSVELPIFTGLSRKHRLARAKSELSREEADARRLMQAVRQEVWSAHSKLRETYEATVSTEVQLRDAQESLRLASERYQAGAGAITDLLDSEAALARAEAVRVAALWDYQAARSALQRSVGELATKTQP
ncbi:MAG: TolC family protein [Bryobacterales bacterium]|nr:TolC family protein [Bryobacterales bacterium]